MMTYASPTLVLVGAAQTLVLGHCEEVTSIVDLSCEKPDPDVRTSDYFELW